MNEKSEGKAEVVIELLEEVGEPSASLRGLIMNQSNTEILRTWEEIAANVDSIADFEEKTGLSAVKKK